jgi:hypothetical protein
MDERVIVLFSLFLASVTADLSVTQDPTWPPDVILGNELNDLQLRCKITSDPNDFNVTWTKDNQPIKSDRYPFYMYGFMNKMNEPLKPLSIKMTPFLLHNIGVNLRTEVFENK